MIEDYTTYTPIWDHMILFTHFSFLFCFFFPFGFTSDAAIVNVVHLFVKGKKKKVVVIDVLPHFVFRGMQIMQ